MALGGGISLVMVRLIACWAMSSVLFVLGIQCHLLVGKLTGGGLAFDIPVYWDLGSLLMAAALTAVIHLPVFIAVEAWRLVRKVDVPFRVYAVFLVVWQVVQTAIFCIDLAGFFVWLGEWLGITDDDYMTYIYAQAALKCVVIYGIAFFAAAAAYRLPKGTKAATN